MGLIEADSSDEEAERLRRQFVPAPDSSDDEPPIEAVVRQEGGRRQPAKAVVGWSRSGGRPALGISSAAGRSSAPKRGHRSAFADSSDEEAERIAKAAASKHHPSEGSAAPPRCVSVREMDSSDEEAAKKAAALAHTRRARGTARGKAGNGAPRPTADKVELDSSDEELARLAAAGKPSAPKPAPSKLPAPKLAPSKPVPSKGKPPGQRVLMDSSDEEVGSCGNHARPQQHARRKQRKQQQQQPQQQPQKHQPPAARLDLASERSAQPSSSTVPGHVSPVAQPASRVSASKAGLAPRVAAIAAAAAARAAALAEERSSSSPSDSASSDGEVEHSPERGVARHLQRLPKRHTHVPSLHKCEAALGPWETSKAAVVEAHLVALDEAMDRKQERATGNKVGPPTAAPPMKLPMKSRATPASQQTAGQEGHSAEASADPRPEGSVGVAAESVGRSEAEDEAQTLAEMVAAADAAEAGVDGPSADTAQAGAAERLAEHVLPRAAKRMAASRPSAQPSAARKRRGSIVVSDDDDDDDDDDGGGDDDDDENQPVQDSHCDPPQRPPQPRTGSRGETRIIDDLGSDIGDGSDGGDDSDGSDGSDDESGDDDDSGEGGEFEREFAVDDEMEVDFDQRGVSGGRGRRGHHLMRPRPKPPPLLAEAAQVGAVWTACHEQRRPSWSTVHLPQPIYQAELRSNLVQVG